MKTKPDPVLSRHRLPQPYRGALAALWVTPTAAVMIVLGAFHGALYDPRLWVPVLVMAIPALVIWREGVDVLPDGLVVRQHGWRYYPYTTLDTWYLDPRPDRRLLTVWHAHNGRVLVVHAAHLTDLSNLLKVLKQKIRYRNWPR